MKIENLIPLATIQKVANVGLHTITGAMFGVPEITFKEAAAIIGTKAYMRRKEARAIANGIASFGLLSDDSMEDFSEKLAHIVMPVIK